MTVKDLSFHGRSELPGMGSRSSTGATEIYVADTPCDAAKAHPDYEQINGELDNNCYVDLNDFSTFALHWLECNDTLLSIGGSCN